MLASNITKKGEGHVKINRVCIIMAQPKQILIHGVDVELTMHTPISVHLKVL